MNFNAPVLSDNIHELNEGFFVVMTAEFDDPTDGSSFVIMNGVALVIIDDNDGKC